METNKNYIAALDVGTTTIKCLIIDSNIKIVGSAFDKVQLLYPEKSYVEIDPEDLWQRILSTIRNAIYDAKLTPNDITSIGISTQRGTFLTWKKDSGEHLHNFITWKDLRTKQYVKDINDLLSIKMIRWACYLVYHLTRSSRFFMGSKLKLSSNHVTPRLLWAIEHIPELKEEISKDNIMFGTLECWLVYKLTKGMTYVTDITNASATGFYDPFTLSWGSWAINILKIPECILPEVVSNDYKFGNVNADIFGCEIPIAAVMGDQSAAMFGACCFKLNDLKITLGTGAFLTVNTWDSIHTSLSGMYPLVGWKIKKDLVYFTEAPCNDAGSIIEWLTHADLIESIKDLKAVTVQSRDTGGLYFIPAFSGLGPPFNDENASSGFIGITPLTQKIDLVKAVLEGLAFRLAVTFNELRKERNVNFSKIFIDGGVGNNDFLCQLMADMTELQVERSNFKEAAALGVAFVAGMNSGVWSNHSELYKLKTVEKVFNPNKTNGKKYLEKLRDWKRAAHKFGNWYLD